MPLAKNDGHRVRRVLAVRVCVALGTRYARFMRDDQHLPGRPISGYHVRGVRE